MPERYPPIIRKLPHMIHGGDYNPEQWLKSPEVLRDDIRMMKLAGWNAATVGVFSWSTYEPREGEFHFDWMDRVLDSLAAAGVGAILATPSGSKPVWMSEKYPEIRRVGADGRREPQRHRHNHCRTSPVYREKCRIINTKLAERYADHPALLAWHISNEFNGRPCHCDLCYRAFHQWLQKRYGTIDALNDAWWTTFWSHRFGEWSEIDPHDDSIDAMMIDWQRFITDQVIDFLLAEAAPLRKITPDVPVTTNMMTTHPWIDYWKLAEHLDVVALDSYPPWHGAEADEDVAVGVAFVHDLYRSLKGGRPFMLMESTPSVVVHMDVHRPKRPGMHMLSSMQAVAHGSDTVQYFQWRAGRGAAEKFHGAVVGHAGHENTRVFREVAEVGTALTRLDDVVGTTVAPQVAIVFDWPNRWAIEQAKMPRNTGKNHDARCVEHYRPFWAAGVPVDVISSDGDFSTYRVLVAPMLYMVRSGVGERIEQFVRDGGVFVTTYLSGVVNETDLCHLGGAPGPLRKVAGVWAEEIDYLHDRCDQGILAVTGNPLGLAGGYAATQYAEVIHAETAEVLATFSRHFYAGQPAVTVNCFGSGQAYYIASRNSRDFLRDFYTAMIGQLSLTRAIDAKLPGGVTAQVRADGDREFVFLMNFRATPRMVDVGSRRFTDLLTGERLTGAIQLNSYGVVVLAKA